MAVQQTTGERGGGEESERASGKKAPSFDGYRDVGHPHAERHRAHPGSRLGRCHRHVPERAQRLRCAISARRRGRLAADRERRNEDHNQPHGADYNRAHTMKFKVPGSEFRVLVLAGAVCVSLTLNAQPGTVNWALHNFDLAGSRFSRMNQLTPQTSRCWCRGGSFRSA